jgi:hypothetical protein
VTTITVVGVSISCAYWFCMIFAVSQNLLLHVDLSLSLSLSLSLLSLSSPDESSCQQW